MGWWRNLFGGGAPPEETRPALLVELMTEFYAESNLALPPEPATAAGPGCSRSRVKRQGIWC